MSADTQVETFLSSVLDKVLVGADTGGLEGLGTQLLILVGDEVDAEREVVNVRTLATQVKDTNLGVGYTTVKPRLGVGLVAERRLANLFHEDHGYNPSFLPPPFSVRFPLEICKRFLGDVLPRQSDEPWRFSVVLMMMLP